MGTRRLATEVARAWARVKSKKRLDLGSGDGLTVGEQEHAVSKRIGTGGDRHLGGKYAAAR